MFGAFSNVKALAPPGVNIRTVMLSWSVAEFIAFVLAVKLLGLGATIIAMMASSFLGIVLLRRVGLEAAQRLSRTMEGHPRDGALLDGTLAALGALLLIFPGFVSDAVGLALAAPSVRQMIRTRLGGAPDVQQSRPVGRRDPPDLIDLSPADWRVVERPGRR